MKGYRPPDKVIGRNGFEEAKKVENFNKSCVEISEAIFRQGPWPTINRVLGGRNVPARYEGASEKVCTVCRRVKPYTEFRISKVHGGKVSRANTCRECLRIERRMQRAEGC